MDACFMARRSEDIGMTRRIINLLFFGEMKFLFLISFEDYRH
jgi:hypothetical protein